MAPCPHCHATAAAEPSASTRWRCAVCGGPVVPSDGSFSRQSGELASLVGAARANGMAMGWMAAGGVLAAGSLVALGLGLLLWHAAHVAALVLAVLAGAGLTLAFASVTRSRTRRAEARTKIDEAFTTVAAELLAARGGAVTAADVSRALQVDERYAERLLAELSAEGRVRVAVGDDAQLSYRPSPGADAELGPRSPDARRGS